MMMLTTPIPPVAHLMLGKLGLGDNATDHNLVSCGTTGAQVAGIGPTAQYLRFPIGGSKHPAAGATATIAGVLDRGVTVAPRLVEKIQDFCCTQTQDGLRFRLVYICAKQNGRRSVPIVRVRLFFSENR